MRKSAVSCPECNAGYSRIELAASPGMTGEFRCKVCDHLLERFDGSRNVVLRLTVEPEKALARGRISQLRSPQSRHENAAGRPLRLP
jgi:hypothetical protein